MLPTGHSGWSARGEEWSWFWVWPEKELTGDPRGSVRRRHHRSDRAFQRVVKVAGRRAGLNRRHSFASGMLDPGYDIRAVKEWADAPGAIVGSG